jgi:hypothetical protein
MITSGRLLRNRDSVASQARLDRRFAGREPAGQNLENWFDQVAGTIRLALSRRVPVGFEDETGFHLGVQAVPADVGMDWERARLLIDGHY